MVDRPRGAGPAFGAMKPVWVLTSGTTISAAQECAYDDLQQLHRATLFGEVTAGAANFDYRYRVTEHLMFSVPSGYPINPQSGQSWEGRVRPDVEVDADTAFDTSHVHASNTSSAWEATGTVALSSTKPHTR